ncbi:hypothetical protein JW905_05575 [bacterium]|nr:hypothetical protein [candidate division CSSED10-310 bacterium]
MPVIGFSSDYLASFTVHEHQGLRPLCRGRFACEEAVIGRQLTLTGIFPGLDPVQSSMDALWRFSGMYRRLACPAVRRNHGRTGLVWIYFR